MPHASAISEPAPHDQNAAHHAIVSDLIRLIGNSVNQIRISGADLGEIDIDLRFYARRL